MKKRNESGGGGENIIKSQQGDKPNKETSEVPVYQLKTIYDWDGRTRKRKCPVPDEAVVVVWYTDNMEKYEQDRAYTHNWDRVRKFAVIRWN